MIHTKVMVAIKKMCDEMNLDLFKVYKVRETPYLFIRIAIQHYLHFEKRFTYEQIKEAFGYNCHSGIIRNCKSVQNLIDTNHEEFLKIRNNVIRYLECIEIRKKERIHLSYTHREIQAMSLSM